MMPMTDFWNSYFRMVQTLCDFTKSIKCGDWNLHLHVSEKMLHWFHGNHNYARHFSYYWVSQQVLVDQHPATYEQFKEDGCSVRRSYGKFNKVSPDQMI